MALVLAGPTLRPHCYPLHPTHYQNSMYSGRTAPCGPTGETGKEASRRLPRGRVAVGAFLPRGASLPERCGCTGRDRGLGVKGLRSGVVYEALFDENAFCRTVRFLSLAMQRKKGRTKTYGRFCGAVVCFKNLSFSRDKCEGRQQLSIVTNFAGAMLALTCPRKYSSRRGVSSASQQPPSPSDVGAPSETVFIPRHRLKRTTRS